MRSKLFCAAALPLFLLAACGGSADDEGQQAEAPATPSDGADTMASRDPAPGEAAPANTDTEQRPVMQAQVVLERLGFGSGVIDGAMGASLTNAVKGFQESRGLAVTGELDDATRSALARWNNIPATRMVTIPESWGDIRFVPVPDGAPQQAEMTHLGYESLVEKLAERFHTTPAVLAQLNPAARPAQASGTPSPSPTPSASVTAVSAPVFSPGQQLRVPNVGADRIVGSEIENKDWLDTLRSLGVGTDQPTAAKVVVDKSEGWLKVFDEGDKLVAMFTVTTGSEHDPLPIGDWEIKGVAYNPPFAYDAELFWDVPDEVGSHQLPPGPNGPVGVVWIDLSKDHYGIHGTPSPETIGSAQSHGCVRLTNWDAARLAVMVSPGTAVVFQE